MEKDTLLINIYIKIHNKQTLTLDDLKYLAKYSPECFEKTCKNVVYNIPESKPVMTPETPQEEPKIEEVLSQEDINIDQILENLRRLEAKDFPMISIDADEVKTLLGNLYMEMLFPHNDRDMYFEAPPYTKPSSFDQKA